MQETMGMRIRGVRKKKNMTMDTLAELSGLTRTSISNYENDKSYPTLFNAICIADVLGVSLDWLAGRKKGVWI
jgi:transcriptional regulator with XRE-family HTH domain